MMEPSPPDSVPGPLPWQSLGRLLPERLRTRVFTPAYYDLIADSTRNAETRPALGIKVVGLLFESLRVGIPDLLWSTRRARRNVLIVAAIVLIAVTFLYVSMYGYSQNIPYDPLGSN